MSKAGIVVGVAGVVLAALAIVGPWWTLSMNISGPTETIAQQVSYGVFGYTYTATQTGAGGGTIAESHAYNATMAQTGTVFTLGMALTVVGAAAGALMIILVAVGGSRPGLRRTGAAMGIIGFLVLLLAPLYVMTALPGAMAADSASVVPGAPAGTFSFAFWGGQTLSFGGEAMTLSYGGGWGWALALVAGIVLLVGAILAFLGPRPAPMAPAPGYPQAPGPYAPPPYPQPYPPQVPPPPSPPPTPPQTPP